MAKLKVSSNGIAVFRCPACGFGHRIPIEGAQKWDWNGNLDAPTITPSILLQFRERKPTNLFVG